MGVAINWFAVKEVVALSSGRTSLLISCIPLEIWWLKLQPQSYSEKGVPILRPPEFL